MRKLKSKLHWSKIMLRYSFYAISSTLFWEKAFKKRYELIDDVWVPRTKNVLKAGGFYWMLLNDSSDGDFAHNNWFDKSSLRERTLERARKWAKRNIAWNFWIYNQVEQGEKSNIEVVVNKLTRNGQKISPLKFAGIKWIQADGTEDWSTNQGDYISKIYSIFGSSKVWFIINGKLYWRRSFIKKIFGYYFTYKSGMADDRYQLTIKIQRENSKFNLKSIIMLKGWKTILFNVLSGAILVAQSQGVDIWELTPELVSTVVVVGNFLLRFLTTTSVGSKE